MVWTSGGPAAYRADWRGGSAFYLYADVSELTPDSAAFAKRMLREIGVAITPGIDFDPVRGNRFVRLSYAGPHSAMREAASRIKSWLGR